MSETSDYWVLLKGAGKNNSGKWKPLATPPKCAGKKKCPRCGSSLITAYELKEVRRRGKPMSVFYEYHKCWNCAWSCRGKKFRLGRIQASHLKVPADPHTGGMTKAVVAPVRAGGLSGRLRRTACRKPIGGK